jgi:hypothetical protein
MLRRIAMLFAAIPLVGCPSAPPPQPATPPPSATAAASAPVPSTLSSAAAPQPTTVAAVAAPFDSWTGVPVEDSAPAGLQLLSDEEVKYAEANCKKLQEKLQQAAKKQKGMAPADAVLEALANPPNVPGVDVKKCADLLRRDVQGYRVSAIESEVSNQIKRIVIGLVSALDRQPSQVCPNVGPTPRELASVQKGPYSSQSSDWKEPGWECARFDLVGQPQRFQYELKTDPASKSFLVVARGYSMPGSPATELFVKGVIPEVSSKGMGRVMRKK